MFKGMNTEGKNAVTYTRWQVSYFTCNVVRIPYESLEDSCQTQLIEQWVKSQFQLNLMMRYPPRTKMRRLALKMSLLVINILQVWSIKTS